jgi:hypothetical protein|tara:strand:- start:160 stop:339 length:180 start_codon:yes stop_codon:yes gene_type:complete
MKKKINKTTPDCLEQERMEYQIFVQDYTLEYLFQDVKKLIKQFPNDMELGAAIRELFRV